MNLVASLNHAVQNLFLITFKISRNILKWDFNVANSLSMIDNEIHLYMMLTMNLLILFCVQIEVKRVKRFQFNAVWMMLECYVIRKVIMQSFHSCNNILSNNHNWSTKKINDMSMSVRNEKILLVKKTIHMKSLQVVTTSDWRICNSLTALILKRLHHIDNVIK